jgi:acyl-CoA dehydrogenase
MVDFRLTEEQRHLRDLVRDFAQREIAPVAAELDREQKFSQAIVDKYFEIGLLHGAVPEMYGGGGLNSLDGCIIAEELGAACAGVASYLGANHLGLTPLLLAGSPELKKELLQIGRAHV